jgi:predicted deacetylase
MMPAQARYLLRLDDLCPTVNRNRWQIFCALIDEFRLRPILAVVPDNQDPELILSPPDSGFWEEMRILEATGATIGLHGLHHLCSSKGRSLLDLHRNSEFAGLDAATQREWIRKGLYFLRSHGLNPRIWVAPRHGFDAQTLNALRAEGIFLLSDGFARVPFSRSGITWIPQQLWGPVDQSRGVWTICTHPNTATDEEIERLRAFIRANAAQFCSLSQILDDYPPSTLPITERLYACVALWRVKLSRERSRMLRFVLRSRSSV